MVQELGVVVRCPECKQLFCYDCDLYIHETLYNCPGCETITIEKPDGDAAEETQPAAMDEE